MSCFIVINGSCSTNMCARQLSFNFSSMVWGGHGPVAPPLDPPLLWATFLSQDVYVYLQTLLRNAPRKLPSSAKKKRKIVPFRRLRSFKVTDFGTNQKHIIRLPINLPPILHRFGDTTLQR